MNKQLENNKVSFYINKWYNVEIEAYKFIHEQAKERLEDLLLESESITNKSFYIVGALATFTGFLLGLFANDAQMIGELLIFILVVLIIGDAIMLYLLIIPKNIKFRGIPPEQAITQEFDHPEDMGFQVQKAYYTSISILQSSIDHMRKKNASRITLYRWALIVFLILIIFSCFVITTWILP